jgi:proteic killer suppression protein
MDKSFKHRGLKELYLNGRTSKIGPNYKAKCLRILDMLENAESLKDLNVPGFYYHKLSGFTPTRYSMRVTGNYRVTFAWIDGEPIDIDLEDYHSGEKV